MYDPSRDSIINECDFFKSTLLSQPEWTSSHIFIYNYDEEHNKAQNKLSALDESEKEDDVIIIFYYGHYKSLKWLDSYFDRFGSKNIAMIICMYNAGLADSDLGENGREILASSKSNEESWSSSVIGDAFNHFICEGLKRAATDKNHDGWISTKEAFDYASPLTTSYLQKNGIQQHPQFFGHIPSRDIPLVST